MTLGCVSSIVLIGVFADKISCEGQLTIACYSVEVAQYLVTIYLCYRLGRQKQTALPSQESTESQNDEVFGLEDQYLELRVKQIRLLLCAFTISIVVGLFDCILVGVSNSAITC